jgi:hypothetical protein
MRLLIVFVCIIWLIAEINLYQLDNGWLWSALVGIPFLIIIGILYNKSQTTNHDTD